MEKSLSVKKESFFTKLFNSIKNIFVKKEIPEDSKEEIIKEEKNDKIEFNNNIKIDVTESILNKQRNFEKNLDLSNMTDEELKELNLLYDSQIIDMQNELKRKLDKIAELREKNKAS